MLRISYGLKKLYHEVITYFQRFRTEKKKSIWILPRSPALLPFVRGEKKIFERPNNICFPTLLPFVRGEK